MKKFIKYLKDWIRLVKSVRELERDIENLENKLLAPEEIKPSSFFSLVYSSFWGDESIRGMSLEEKVNALANVLKIKFEWSEKKDKEVIAKLRIRK